VPPQVPAANSISSISPQRRSNGQDHPSPFARPAQRPFSYSQPLQSPQSYGFAENPYGISPANSGPPKPQPGQHGHRLRDRASAPGPMTRLSSGSGNGLNPRPTSYGILPTPDPTIASCISDEDVALQLMRLGDASNFSSHGRTSASTLDETLSGKADVASSVSSVDEDDGDHSMREPLLPQVRSMGQSGKTKKQLGYIDNVLPTSDTIEPSGDEDYNDDHDDLVNEFGQPTKRPRLSAPKSIMGASKARNSTSKKANKPSKIQQQITSKKTKPYISHNTAKTAMSPPALPPQSRKASTASTAPPPNGLDIDEDLSTKPRCVRCRKSKKGCDRQRPCQRCKDAGIGPEGCVSEDEGNGRKGRFGRHMGVSLANGGSAIESEEAEVILDDIAAAQEKIKKRKRPVM